MTMTMTSPKPRPVFIAALPREIASLVVHRGWRADERLLTRNIRLFEHEDAIVVCAGMGASRASLAVEAALTFGPASELISVGWVGACNDRIQVGDVLRPHIVVDAKTGERFLTAQTRAESEEIKIVVTVAVPAGAKEKERLSVSYYALAVDMEAAAVARIARARELPFYAIKAISDDSHFELPDLARFTTPDGQFREAAFGFYAALHPRLWKPVALLAKGSKLAATRLCTEIDAHIQLDRDLKS
jgi:adenosylhomocysteine nucleosidase